MPKKNSDDKLAPLKKRKTGSKSDSFVPHQITDFEPLPAQPSAKRRAGAKAGSAGAESAAATPKSAARGRAKAQDKKPAEGKTPGGEKAKAKPRSGAAPKVGFRDTPGAASGSDSPKPPAALLVNKPARRRKSAFRQSDVAGGTGTQIIPNLSPQFAPDILKRLGRDTEGAPALRTTDSSSRSALKVIPLGGLCEIGKNMTVYEYGNDMIIVDVGVAFPEENQPGIDSVIPDMSYVLDNRHKLRGIFFTHGHEDHIGSISWLLLQVAAPMYGTRMTCELLRLKMEDKGLGSQTSLLNVVEVGSSVRAGCFDVEFVHVNHSIADAAALAIRTPAGLAVHSGDFKIDYTPIHGGPINLQRMAELGSEGVMLFVCESTNIERKGFSPSERIVGETFVQQFAKAEGRVIVATFSSNVHRVQQIITAAEAQQRKVAIVGRSMVNVFKAAQNLNYIDIRPGTLIDLNEIDKYPPDKLCIITTGSQGETMSALTRMAYSEHRNVEIGAGDTVIISATPIPGNEKPIFRVINELYKRRAKVVYSDMADIHVSGHAYREEIKILHQLLKPRFFLPAHGEYRHLYIHAQVAHEMGQPMESIYILNNGDIFECRADKARIAGYTQTGAILIDGSPQGTVDSAILEQRRALSDDGVYTVALAVDRTGKKLIGKPVVNARGFTYEKDMPGLEAESIRRINDFVANAQKQGAGLSSNLLVVQLREQLQNMLYQRTRRRPVLLISVIEAK